MDFVNKIAEKLSFSKKEEAPSAPVVRIPGFLDGLNDNKVQFETILTNIKKISPDSYIYTYSLPNPDLPLGLLPGHHVVVYADINGDRVKREYTPISDFNRKGSFDLLIKVYRSNVHPDFPRGGKLTQYLESVKVGEKVVMSGPKFKKTYLGHGRLNWRGTEFNVKEIGMIAGGTGIAPMYQVIRALLDNPPDQTKLHLLFANRSEADILIKEELVQAAKDPRIKVHYVVDQGTSTWKGFTGLISKEMLQKTMPKPSNGLLLWACGPKPMHRLVKSHFQELGYNMDNAMM